MEDDLVNDILTTEMDRLVQHARVSDEFLPRRGPRVLGGSMRAWLQSDGQPPAGIPKELLGLDNGMHLIEPGPYTWHVMVADTGGGKVTCSTMRPKTERVHDFGLIVLGGGDLRGRRLCAVKAGGRRRGRAAARPDRPAVDLGARLSGPGRDA